MTGIPDPDPVQHRRRHSNAWKNTPVLVKIAVGVCLVAFVVSVFVLRRSSTKAPPPPPSMAETFDALVANLPKADLILSQSSLNLETRCIEGVLTNTSARAYSDIEITFFVASSDQSSSEIRNATVASLAPHGNAPFSTRPVGQDTAGWSMKEIKGTPVSGAGAAKKSFPTAPGR